MESKPIGREQMMPASSLEQQTDLILRMLRDGPRTNAELSEVALKYTSRISDLRKLGHVIECKRISGERTYEYRLLAKPACHLAHNDPKWQLEVTDRECRIWGVVWMKSTCRCCGKFLGRRPRDYRSWDHIRSSQERKPDARP